MIYSKNHMNSIIYFGELKDIKIEGKETPIKHEEKSFFGKISNVVGKMLDCCRE